MATLTLTCQNFHHQKHKSPLTQSAVKESLFESLHQQTGWKKKYPSQPPDKNRFQVSKMYPIYHTEEAIT